MGVRSLVCGEKGDRFWEFAEGLQLRPSSTSVWEFGRAIAFCLWECDRVHGASLFERLLYQRLRQRQRREALLLADRFFAGRGDVYDWLRQSKNAGFSAIAQLH